MVELFQYCLKFMIKYNSETEERCEIIMWITVVYKMELFKDSHVTIVEMILN